MASYGQSLDKAFKFPKIKRGFVGDSIPQFATPSANEQRRLQTSRPAEEPKESVVLSAEQTGGVLMKPESETGSLLGQPSNHVADKVFAGYAMKKSPSAFVGWQMRFFVLSEDGILSYYQAVWLLLLTR